MASSTSGLRRWWWRCIAVTAVMALHPPAAVAAPAETSTLHSGDLIVPLTQVQAIVGEPTLEAKRREDRTSPWADHSMDTQLSPACRRYINQDEVFGDTWSNFASTRYGAASNLGVLQAIAVYPDAQAARQAFEAAKTAERQCHAEHPADVFSPGYTRTELDPQTVLDRYPETENGPGSAGIFAWRGQVLVEVSAAHLSTDPRIAQAVLTLITQKVPT